MRRDHPLSGKRGAILNSPLPKCCLPLSSFFPRSSAYFGGVRRSPAQALALPISGDQGALVGGGPPPKVPRIRQGDAQTNIHVATH